MPPYSNLTLLIIAGQHRLGGLTTITFNATSYVAVLLSEFQNAGVAATLKDVIIKNVVQTTLSSIQLFNILNGEKFKDLNRKLLQTDSGAMLINYEITVSGAHATIAETTLNELTLTNFAPLGVVSFTTTIAPRVSIYQAPTSEKTNGIPNTTMYGIIGAAVGFAIVCGFAVYFILFFQRKNNGKLFKRATKPSQFKA